MSYVLTGGLRAQMGPDQLEPLSGMTVRIYRLPAGTTTSTARAVPAFSALSDEEIRDKEHRWAAQVWTDEQGRFVVDLNDASLPRHRGTLHEYAGEPVEIDVYCRAVSGQEAQLGREIQFTVARLQPDWEPTDTGSRASLSCDLSLEFWSRARAAMGAWAILGRVVNASRAPLAGLRVLAFDADVLRDDPIGSGETDAEGRFRIDYTAAAFRNPRVPVDHERGGPDLYFRIESGDGRLLLSEDRSRGTQPDRHNVGSCFSAELLVDA